MTMTLDRTASSRGFLPTPLARIGLIIPSSNRLTEPQLRHFAPAELGIHVTRLQMTGKWNRPLSQLTEDIERMTPVEFESYMRSIGMVALPIGSEDRHTQRRLSDA